MTSAACVLDHAIEWICFDGEAWKIICSCSWEAWDSPSEDDVRDAFDDHVLDDARTRLRAYHETKKAEILGR